MQWFAKAPANIALIKYMGKKDSVSNVPDNPSLSYTLNALTTEVMLTPLEGEHDQWAPISGSNFRLSPLAQERFLNHLLFLKKQLGYQGAFLVQSQNSFPHAAGLASSASSFAALTRCALEAISILQNQPIPSTAVQAQLSRLGSGSSCRSFYSPWALWDDQTVAPIELPYSELLHRVILIDSAEKKVSSSEAHRRVRTSPAYSARPSRASERLTGLVTALRSQDWSQAYEICWDEFQDMHALFSNCDEPFSYITEKTTRVLTALQEIWQVQGDGPLVTMDAGPNIHLLYRPDQVDLMFKINAQIDALLDGPHGG